MLESKVLGGFSLTVYQARLDTSVSSIGTMSPQIQINYSGIKIKTKTATGMDRLPVWSETFNFECLSPDLELIAYHKPLLLKDIEIGRCRIAVEENSGWFELRNNGKKVGSIRIAIKDDKDTWMSTSHTIKDSWDLRDDYLKKINELELEKEEALFYKKKYKLKLEKIRQQKRKSNGVGQQKNSEEFNDCESQDFIGKVTERIKKLQVGQEELLKRKELLRLQEENLSSEKAKVLVEWEENVKTRMEFKTMKQKVNDEYQKLKIEQEKVFEQIRASEQLRQGGRPNREQQRFQQIMSRIQCISSPEHVWKYENLTDWRSQSIEELHEKAEVNRVPLTVEKPRPPLHPLSSNSSRLITFE